MIDPNRERSLGDAAGASRRGSPNKPQPQSHTEGTNRDFDESGESANQAHGHPREERESGRSRQK